MLLPLRERCGVRVGREPILITEDILLFTECPLLVDTEPSDEMTESGLGIISTFSEKPTRGRDPGLLGEESRDSDLGSIDVAGFSSTGAVRGASVGRSIGVLGRLELSLGSGSAVGSMMLLTSWLDKAADRRCACPRLPVLSGTGNVGLG